MKNGMQQDKYFHKRIPTYILTKLLVNTQRYIIRLEVTFSPSKTHNQHILEVISPINK